MFHFFRFWLGSLSRCFRSRQSLLLENLALRQQLAVLKRRHPRPKLSPLDKLFWALACQFWSAWKQALLVVTPRDRGPLPSRRLPPVLESDLQGETASRKEEAVQGGPASHLPNGGGEPTWGAPRIHGELLILGFDVSERTISRWMKRACKDPEPARSWLTFLHNHREAIAAMDFFTVPTITFGVLYCFFIIGHDRRRILHVNVTRHPTGAWIVQQLREAFPYERATEFLLLDHDSKYGTEVPVAIRSMDIKAVRTAVGCPWQTVQGLRLDMSRGAWDCQRTWSLLGSTAVRSLAFAGGPALEKACGKNCGTG